MFIMQKILVLLLVVGVLGKAVLGNSNRDRSNDNDDNKDDNSDGNGNNDEDKSNDESDGNSNSGSDPDSDSSARSIRNDVEQKYHFYGDLDATVVRGNGEEVAYKDNLTGPVFVTRKAFRRLQALGEFSASVNGFAVLTGKRNACFGPHQAKADLFFNIPDRKRGSLKVFMYQGPLWLELGDLDVNGGDNMVRLKGTITLKFEIDVSSRKRRDLGGEPLVEVVKKMNAVEGMVAQINDIDG